MKKPFLIIALFTFVINCIVDAQDISIGINNQELVHYDRIRSDSIIYINYIPTIQYQTKKQYFKLLDPEVAVSFNSRYPRSYNDGPIWKGKGLTPEVNMGFQWKKGILHATFYPVVFWSQNLSFGLADQVNETNPYNYQFNFGRSLDYVQRYGPDSFSKFHWGQSEVALVIKKLQVSLSTQNFSFGPSSYNSIVMSNSGAGFPHLTIGTSKPIQLKIKQTELGKIESHIYYGMLKESQYFDSLESNGDRYFNAWSIGYEVPYLKGITLGFQRSLYKSAEYFNSEDLFAMIHVADDGVVLSSTGDTLINTNDTFDQLAAAFISWKIDAQDMRIYFEFARNDFNGSFRRFLQEFEHSRAYSIGLDKVFQLAKSDLHLSYEHTFLPRYKSYQYRPNPTFYSHHIVRQGYTHDGQLIGAGIGPGSVSDLISLNLIKPGGLLGMTMQRIRFDEDYFIVGIPDPQNKVNKHDVEYSLGLKYARRSNNVYWGLNATFSYRLNMYYKPLNDKINVYSKVFVRYLF